MSAITDKMLEWKQLTISARISMLIFALIGTVSIPIGVWMGMRFVDTADKQTQILQDIRVTLAAGVEHTKTQDTRLESLEGRAHNDEVTLQSHGDRILRLEDRAGAALATVPR